MNATPHHTHPNIVRRLKRVEGHLRSIIAMIEAQRECLELAQQLYAVEKAVANAKRTLIHDHIDHCLEQSMAYRRAESGRPWRSSKHLPSFCRTVRILVFKQ